MSSVQIRLASYILKDHFGENVEKIVVYLLHKGRRNLREIVLATKLEKSLVSQKPRLKKMILAYFYMASL